MKISIITATFNSAKTLQRMIDSLLSQSYMDWEHIIVDGGSTDQTLTIIQQNIKAYTGRVQYISEHDNGIYDAINKGILRATGDIIGILNSDDILADNDVLQHITNAFQLQKAQIIYGDLVYFNQNRIVRHWHSNDYKPAQLQYGWMPAHPTFYCLRQIYQETGLYDTSFHISADYDFMLRTLKQSYHVIYIPKVLVKMQIGGASNRNCRAILTKSREDVRALHKNNIHFSWFTVLCKNLRKIMQFLR